MSSCEPPRLPGTSSKPCWAAAGVDEPPHDLDEAPSTSDVSELGWEESPSSGLLAPSDAATEKCLKKRIEAGDRRAVFYLGQLYFDTGDFDLAKQYFVPIATDNIFAQYQLGVMFFEGLGLKQDMKKGFRLMLKVAMSVPKTPEHEEVIHKAQYNVARAYFTGFGVQSSEEDGQRWLERAAANGSRRGSVKAQTMLAMLFARRDYLDLKSSFFWHSEATGNGSLESQGALGVLFLYGLGVRRDLVSARLCLSQAARRGNIYAAGQLAFFYYRFHFYQQAVRFGAHLARFKEADVARLARQSECLERYVRRGLATGCFVLSRCWQRGLGGLPADAEQAQLVGGRAAELDPATADRLQQLTTNGPWLRSPDS